VRTNCTSPTLSTPRALSLTPSSARVLARQVTFPSCWTNTCCSHPLHSADELGAGAGGLLDGAVVGCARAAIRKLEQELGVPRATFTPEAFVFLNRIHYLSRARADAPAVERAEFGEHEIDYLYVLRAPAAGLPLAPNPNEVCATRYVDRAEMQAMLAAARRGELRLTPWFEMIAEQFLFKWWAQLDDERALLAMRDSVGIFRFGECADDV
jgi:isopentenyl-diphosphate delta-isomerase